MDLYLVGMHTGMVLDGIKPCAEGYDLWSYRYLNCRSTFQMVEERKQKQKSIDSERLV
jgi:hypothetical protein